MSSNIIYEIYTSTAKKRTFEEQVSELLEKSSSDKPIIRLTFFGSPTSNEEYVKQLNIIQKETNDIFRNNLPSISYVAQKPLIGNLILESSKLSNPTWNINYQSNESIRYTELENTNNKILIINILPENIQNNIKAQSQDVFARFEDILCNKGYDINSIVRQWNYIERITEFENKYQHYQSFNDARSHFYSKVDWINGYPAATGIGTQYGGIMIDAVITKSQNSDYKCIPLNNDLQIAAYDYSQDVLLGAKDEILQVKSTPKFERAKAITDGKHGLVYISGTAAIRGEDSLTNVGIEEQTRITMENIYYLISKQNLNKAGIDINKDCSLDMLRVYLKNAEEVQIVKDYLDNLIPSIPVSYLLADVCREELLIEIEGIASFSVSD